MVCHRLLRTAAIDVLEPMDLPPGDRQPTKFGCVCVPAASIISIGGPAGIAPSDSMPHIGGCEITGEVADIGAAVKNVAVGQTVLIAPNQGCGHCAECFLRQRPGLPRVLHPR